MFAFKNFNFNIEYPLFYFGDNSDEIVSGTGHKDRIFGNGGDDKLYGNSGHDLLSGGSGDDTLDGGGGSDLLLGGSGNDLIVGDDGDDTLKGGDGDDYLNGQWGNDVLDGGDGDDQLWGGYGGWFGTVQNTMTGGAGSDTFNMSYQGQIINFVTDFEVGVDKVGMSDFGLGFDEFAEAMSISTQVGNDVVIDISSYTHGGTNQMVLQNVQLTDLTANDFSF